MEAEIFRLVNILEKSAMTLPIREGILTSDDLIHLKDDRIALNLEATSVSIYSLDSALLQTAYS